MDAPKPLRGIVRERLCLKSTLDKCQYDPAAKVYYREIQETPDTNQAAALPKTDEAEEDSLEDFKSPVKKIEKKVKKKVVQRRPDPSRTYTYPQGCSSTQEMFVYAYYTSEVQNHSEDEFEIFNDKKVKEEYLLNKANFLARCGVLETTPSAAPPTLKPSLETARSTPTETLLVDNKDSIEKSVGNSASRVGFDLLPPQCTTNCKSEGKIKHSLRTGLKNIKIQNVIIDDSDDSDDEVPASQAIRSESKSVEKILEEDDSLDGRTNICTKTSILEEASLNPVSPKTESVLLIEDTNCMHKKMDIKDTSSPRLQCTEMHSNDDTSSARNLILEKSTVQSTGSNWRVQKMNQASNKPSRRNVKSYRCKKFRFPYIRSLHWKNKIFNRKQVIDSCIPGMQK